jgi:hypothetical protein
VDNRLFVVERGAGIQLVNLDTLTKSTFLNLSAYLTDSGTPVNTGSESGILSLAFHPNYNQTVYFYVFFSLDIGGQLHQRVARFQATGTAGTTTRRPRPMRHAIAAHHAARPGRQSQRW